jgi:CheY-like chemotaxis protein
MATGTSAATLSTPMSELRPARRERILVIEDDGASRKILRRFFSSEGYEVDVVPDSVCGLEMLRQRVPAAVILDLLCPGSSGCDLCKKIANLIPGLLLVILTQAQTLRAGSFSWKWVPTITSPCHSAQGTDCTPACANQTCTARQPGRPRHICLCGRDSGFF